MNAALIPEPQLSPIQEKKNTTLLHLTVWSVPKANSCCLAQKNQSKATQAQVKLFQISMVQSHSRNRPVQQTAVPVPTVPTKQPLGPVSLSLEAPKVWSKVLHQRKGFWVKPSREVIVYHGRTSKGNIWVSIKHYSKHLAVPPLYPSLECCH